MKCRVSGIQNLESSVYQSVARAITRGNRSEKALSSTAYESKDIFHDDQDQNLCIASLRRRHSAAVVRECFQRSTSMNSQPTQRSLGPFLEFISTITTLMSITLSLSTVLCAILSTKKYSLTKSIGLIKSHHLIKFSFAHIR